jgi:hypothetical protein
MIWQAIGPLTLAPIKARHPPSELMQMNHLFRMSTSLEKTSKIAFLFSPKATEDCCFCLFFGCGLDVALMAWQMLNAYKFFPDSSTLVLLLWALFFMKCYPTEDHACLTVGGSQRAIDPKTLCKHIWPLITGLSD